MKGDRLIVDPQLTKVHFELISRLSCGWQPNHAGLIEEFLVAWRRAFSASTDNLEIGHSFVRFRCRLRDIKLRNFDNLDCLIIGDACSDQVIREWKSSGSNNDIQRVALALGDVCFIHADDVLPASRGFLVMAPNDVHGLITSAFAVPHLTSIARRRFSPMRLNPFGINAPPGTNMFTGRATELEILLQSVKNGYAIAGPGRIGKTSLVKRFLNALPELDPSRALRSEYIDFYDCGTTERTIARHIAKRINPNRRADEMTEENLEAFLRFERKLRGGPLELVLDEVDRVCTSETFQVLAECSKHEICRLILCGRGGLYEAMHDSKRVFSDRLRLMKLDSLTPEEGHELLLQPLKELGFDFDNPEELADAVCNETGRLPHLIQYYGGEFVERTAKRRSDKITFETFISIRDDRDTIATIAGPLENIQDEFSEWIALALMIRSIHTVTERDVCRVALEEGLEIGEREAARICRNLYINNVFSWQQDKYHFANPALLRYAKTRDYFKPRLRELRKLAGAVREGKWNAS